MFAQGVNQPFAAGFGIGKRFNGRKGLGRNNKQRRLGINLVQNLGAGRSVNIGNEIAVDILASSSPICIPKHWKGRKCSFT